MHGDYAHGGDDKMMEKNEGEEMDTGSESEMAYQVTLTMYPDGRVAVGEPGAIPKAEYEMDDKPEKGGEDYSMDMMKKGHMGGEPMQDSPYGKKFGSLDKAIKYLTSMNMSGGDSDQEAMMQEGYRGKNDSSMKKESYA